MGTINEITDSSYFVFLFVGAIKVLILRTVFVLILSNPNNINTYTILPAINIKFPLFNIIAHIAANNILTLFIILILPLNII